ncbi:hypothetical protein FTUN_1210 [Frigoriglobus tundricola]|uniref:Uncharacterized protein n=1 Tax=Frigoriglobus tundricola TaxID=2774151 RepID=A0A6M5YK37_9BACT|nr:hypothetical protein FTUN_1210 [Frigoriglobus tundricola]
MTCRRSVPVLRPLPKITTIPDGTRPAGLARRIQKRRPVSRFSDMQIRIYDKRSIRNRVDLTLVRGYLGRFL